jgi:hypothetical protein
VGQERNLLLGPLGSPHRSCRLGLAAWMDGHRAVRVDGINSSRLQHCLQQAQAPSLRELGHLITNCHASTLDFERQRVQPHPTLITFASLARLHLVRLDGGLGTT